MKITLKGETYYSGELLYGDLYKATDYQKYLSEGGSKGKDPSAEYEKMAQIVVDLFGNQFSLKDLKEKLPLKGSITTLVNIIRGIEEEAKSAIEIKNE